MNLHEYQAKELFSRYGIAVPKGVVMRAPEDVGRLAEVPGPPWVVKAQIHAGGRGKAGGVKIAKTREEASNAVRALLGKRLVTFQTDERGQPVSAVWVEEASVISREMYLGATMDRSKKRVVFMTSSEGGMDIEEVARTHPERIHLEVIEPLVGLMPYQCREIGFSLKLEPSQMRDLEKILLGLYRIFMERDLSMIEVNPLVVADGGRLVCLDAKAVVDDNALFRQPDMDLMFDPSQEDEKENKAREANISYVALSGNIGCMVNGAGLAMATMDIIKLAGGEPANFLDVGGGATEERVRTAFEIILADPQVKAILVNIFGGIVRCDLIAEGVVAAIKEVGVKVPVVVRLEGNRAQEAEKILGESGVSVLPAQGLADAAQKVVAAAKGAA